MAVNPYMDRQDQDDGGIVSQINTTPLVDVMLVLLIIFLITIPVATHTIPVALPQGENKLTLARYGAVILAITKERQLYWNDSPVIDGQDLLLRLKKIAILDPQPQVQIRGDRNVEFSRVWDVLNACQKVGITRVDFITQNDNARR